MAQVTVPLMESVQVTVFQTEFLRAPLPAQKAKQEVPQAKQEVPQAKQQLPKAKRTVPQAKRMATKRDLVRVEGVGGALADALETGCYLSRRYRATDLRHETKRPSKGLAGLESDHTQK
jgi:hypothetical protein